MSNFRWKAKDLLKWGLPVLVLVAASAFYYKNLHYFIPFTQFKIDVVFAADTKDIVRALKVPTYEGDMQKHFLFSFTLAPLIDLVEMIPFMNESRAMRAVLSLVAGLNVAGMYAWLQGQVRSIPKSIAYTLLYALSFGVLMVYSIPETYAMSNLAALLYLLTFSRFYPDASWKTNLILTALAGLASLYNPPLLSLIGIHLIAALTRLPFWQWIFQSAISAALGLAIYFGAHLSIYHAPGFFNFMQTYSSTWGSASNYLDMDKIFTVLTVFFAFNFTSPVQYAPTTLGPQHLSGYLNTLPALVASIALTAGLLYAWIKTLRHTQPRQSLFLGLTAWIVVMTLFYIYFNPLEAVLYASQITAPLVFIFAIGIEQLPIAPRIKYTALGIILALLAWNNIAALYGGFAG